MSHLETIVSILQRRNTAGIDADKSEVGLLKLDELQKLCKAAAEAIIEIRIALTTSAGLISGYEDKGGGGFECRSAGWLVQHLTETMYVMNKLQLAAFHELNRRGYSLHGKRICAMGSE